MAQAPDGSTEPLPQAPLGTFPRAAPPCQRESLKATAPTAVPQAEQAALGGRQGGEWGAASGSDQARWGGAGGSQGGARARPACLGQNQAPAEALATPPPSLGPRG